MYKDLQRTCTAIVLLIKPFHGLAKFPLPFGFVNSLRASSYEPGNRAGSVTGTNSVVCSYGKFQLGRPG